jgi:hypothetical protein
MAKESSMHGQSGESSSRYANPNMQGLMSILERALIGQAVNPPNTAISVPQQQAATLGQAGPFGSANYLGIGANQSLAPGPNQAGLQSRAQLGLPDRSSYFSFLPTAQQVASLGMLPPLNPAKGTAKGQKQLAKLEGKKKQTPARVAKEADIRKRNPEAVG